MDSNLDWTSFQFGEISHLATTSFDPYTGKVAWIFNNINLPPNVNPPEGEGYVSFTVKHKKNLSTGTVIKNKATIDFELDFPPAPIDTPEVFNIIDSQAPISSIDPFSAKQSSTSFEISWSGNDGEGSGVGSFTICVSDNNDPYGIWLGNTSDTSAVFTGEEGHTYRFYSIATDNVSNVEPQPNVPDIVTYINIYDSDESEEQDNNKGGGCFIKQFSQ